MLTIEVFSRFSLFRLRRQWYFRVKAANGEIVAHSEGYNQKESAYSTISLLQSEMGLAVIKQLP